MNRFTQYDEDAYRLPEGVKRIAYDADSQRYLFRDSSGKLYQGEPGEQYGIMRPISSPAPASSHRRAATVVAIHRPPEKMHAPKVPKTFHDILPSTHVTRAPSSPSGEAHDTLGHSKGLVRSMTVRLAQRVSAGGKLQRSNSTPSSQSKVAQLFSVIPPSYNPLHRPTRGGYDHLRSKEEFQ